MTPRPLPCLLALAALFTSGVTAPFARAAAKATPLVAPGAQVEKVAEGFMHGEGPLWHPEGLLLFGDTPRDRIVRVDESGAVSVFREPAGRTTALAFDPEGRLVANESHGGDEGRRRVARREKNGEWVTLADRFEGKRLNSPNDLAIDSRGRIYFTDPRYSKPETRELDHESVYRIDPDGKLTRLIGTLTRPNGILVTTDARTLYVADNPATGEKRATLWAFDLDADGNASHGRVLHEFTTARGLDGMTLDSDGRIWAAGGEGATAGIYVFEPDAKRATARLATVIALPQTPTNCTFGGKNLDTLYITSDPILFRLRTAVHGRPTPPGK